jgi:hypothetical protein
MATIDLITYDQKMVTPKDDALIHQFGISNGVLYGCEVTLANSNTLHITGGQGVIYGRQWEIAEGDITVTLPASGSLKGRLYVKIDLSNTTNPIELLVQTAVTLPDLTDDDQINVDNSVSELELCTFDASSLTISNLVRTVEQVADGDHQDVVDLQADVSEIKSNVTELEAKKLYRETITFSRLGNGYATKDLGSDFGDNGTYYCIGANAVISVNSQVAVACGIQEGRYIRMTMNWNSAYLNSDVWLTYYYVRTSDIVVNT